MALGQTHSLRDEEMIDVPVGKGDVKKKLISISEYNMCMKGVDRAHQYLAYYSLLRKTLKWAKKVALWLISCALFNSFVIYKKLNPTTELRYKEWQKPGLQIRWRWQKHSQIGTLKPYPT
jgi:hypothetical protein